MTEENLGFAIRSEAYLSRFPYIRRYAEDFDIPEVLPFSLDLLDWRAYTCDWLNQMFEYRVGLAFPEERSIYFLDEKGEELAAVKPFHCIEKRLKWHGLAFDESQNTERPGETVYSAICSFPDVDRIRVVLVIDKKRFNKGKRIALYLIPGAVTMSAWISRLNEVAKKEIEDRIAEISSLA